MPAISSYESPSYSLIMKTSRCSAGRFFTTDAIRSSISDASREASGESAALLPSMSPSLSGLRLHTRPSLPFEDRRVRPLMIPEGPMSEDTLDEAACREVRSRHYALGVAPYNIDHGGFYANIHALLHRLANCRWVGVGADGSLHRLWWLDDPQFLKRETE